MRGIVIFAIVLFVFIFGTVTFIILQDKSVKNFEAKKLENEIVGKGSEISKEESSSPITIAGGSFSSDDSGGSGGDSSDSEPNTPLICKPQQIQYSLKNFNEKIECLEINEEICTKLNAFCSVDVYNIDLDVEENFTIEYILINSLEEEIDSVILNKNVNVSSPVKFSMNITVEDSFGIDLFSKCSPRILVVPKKEVCN